MTTALLHPPHTAASFSDLGVPPRIVDALARAGITTPFPVQAATLTDALAGRDVLGCARTGTGKTLAFAIPMVASLAAATSRRTPWRPRGLILVPTRELARQVAAVITPLATAVELTTATVFGGVGQGPQVDAMRRGVDIVVACPGRLEDLVAQNRCRLDRIAVTVIDEADHMADLGFLPAVRRLLDATPRGQRLLFSATLDNGVDVLVKRYLTDPVAHDVVDSAEPSTIDHHVFEIAAADKAQIVHELASGKGRSVLFTRTKHSAKKLATRLSRSGIGAVELHGNLSQAARDRNLATFTAGTTPVLVATDIAARGIHVDDVELIVHVDPPAEHKAYVHRSGRTARAGAVGNVVTLMTPDQRTDVRKLTRAAGVAAVFVSVAPGDDAISALVDRRAHPAPTPRPRRRRRTRR